MAYAKHIDISHTMHHKLQIVLVMLDKYKQRVSVAVAAREHGGCCGIFQGILGLGVGGGLTKYVCILTCF